MAKGTSVKPRVDEALAEAVADRAGDHGTDRSEAIRAALHKLLGEL